MNEHRWIWKDAPAQWYLILFLIFWVMIFGLITLILTSDIGQGATISTVDNRYYDISIESSSDNVARGPDNLLRYAYHYDNTSLKMATSDDNGTSWDYETVIEDTWESNTQIIFYGIQVLSNNTTCILFRAQGALGNTWSLNLAFKWNNVGDWEIVNIHKQNTFYYASCDLAVNDTDILCYLAKYGTSYTTIYAGVCNPSTRSTTFTAWSSSLTSLNYISVTTNRTGKFWFSYTYWDGSWYRINFGDYLKTLSVRYNQIANLFQIYTTGFIGLANGGLAASIMGYYSGIGYYYLYYVYMLEGSSTITKLAIISTTQVLTYIRGGISTNALNYVYIFYYNTTSDKYIRLGAEYDADLSTWQNSGVWVKSVNSNDLIYGSTSTSNLYPQKSGVNVGMTQSGSSTAWIWIMENGAIDTHRLQYYLDGTYPFISYEPMAIMNTTMQTGYVEMDYIHRFWVANGNQPFTWSIEFISEPNNGWFSIDILGNGQYCYIYGICPDTVGSYTLKITVEDFYGNVENEILTLVVNTISIGEGPAEEPELELIWPDVDFMGSFWIFLVCLAVFVGLWKTLKDHVTNQPSLDLITRRRRRY